jgi:hypothetical protein
MRGQVTSGKTVGTDLSDCTPVSSTKADCTGALGLDSGLLEARFSLNFATGAIIGTITGGTMAYRHATGTIAGSSFNGGAHLTVSYHQSRARSTRTCRRLCDEGLRTSRTHVSDPAASAAGLVRCVLVVTGAQEAGFVAAHNHLDAVTDAEFGEDGGDVGLYGRFAKEHSLCDLGIGQALCEVAGGVEFAR